MSQAAWSHLLFVTVAGSHPPPFQNELYVPSSNLKTPMLWETVTGPHGSDYWFHT